MEKALNLNSHIFRKKKVKNLNFVPIVIKFCKPFCVKTKQENFQLECHFESPQKESFCFYLKICSPTYSNLPTVEQQQMYNIPKYCTIRILKTFYFLSSNSLSKLTFMKLYGILLS